jgi:hypothetical protein
MEGSETSAKKISKNCKKKKKKKKKKNPKNTETNKKVIHQNKYRDGGKRKRDRGHQV